MSLPGPTGAHPRQNGLRSNRKGRQDARRPRGQSLVTLRGLHPPSRAEEQLRKGRGTASNKDHPSCRAQRPASRAHCDPQDSGTGLSFHHHQQQAPNSLVIHEPAVSTGCAEKAGPVPVPEERQEEGAEGAPSSHSTKHGQLSCGGGSVPPSVCCVQPCHGVTTNEQKPD